MSRFPYACDDLLLYMGDRLYLDLLSVTLQASQITLLVVVKIWNAHRYHQQNVDMDLSEDLCRALSTLSLHIEEGYEGSNTTLAAVFVDSDH